MNIKNFDFYKDNKTEIEHLINGYAELPTIKTIKGTRIILTSNQKNIVSRLKNVCDLYETEIEANEENCFLYTMIECLNSNGITL